MLRFYREVRENVELQRKLLLTFAVYFSYVLHGWSEQQIGVALPSLQALIRVDKEKLSTILVVWNVGYVMGSLISGVLFDKYNRIVLMLMLTLGLAVGTALLPLCSSLLSMLVCRFFLGVFNGGSDTGSNTIIPTVWKDRCGPFCQMLYVCYAIGAILSPFATIPFISTTSVFVSNSTTNSKVDGKQENGIYPAFLITSGIFVLCAITYLLMQLFGKLNELSNQSAIDNDTGYLIVGEKDPQYKSLICLMAAVHALSIATAEDITAYLITFTTEYLQWNELESATLMSSYWISGCCSGVLGAVILNYADCSWVLWFAVVLLNLSFGSVILGCFMAKWLVWIGFVLCGFSIILIIPTVFSWSQKYICEITGKVSAIYTVSCALVSATSAYFIGFMIENYSSLTFIFMLFIFAALCLIFFISAYSVRFNCCSY